MRTFAVAIVSLFLFGCVGNIVDTEQRREMTPQEIKKTLAGDDFRQKNKAREQLNKLPPAERVTVLKELLAEGDSPTRLLALSEVMKLPESTAKPIIEDVAKNDPDEEIREFAETALEMYEEEGEE